MRPDRPNGNGRLDPAEREAFREAVHTLNARYFVGGK
jgi:hypothetical protein